MSGLICNIFCTLQDEKINRDPELIIVSPDYPEIVKTILEQDGIQYHIFQY